MTSQPEKKTLTEDVGGMFGFRVVWGYLPHWCNFKVYALVSNNDDGPLFYSKKAVTSERLTANTRQAVIHAQGGVGVKGKMVIESTERCMRDSNGVKMEMALLKYLHVRAMALMNSTEDPWTADDKKLPEMKAL